MDEHCTVFEIHPKSLILQHCELKELLLLVKQIQASNGNNSALSLVTQIVDTSASNAVFRIGNQSIPANSTLDIITNVLVLEEGDSIKMTCSTADEIQGVISYALLDRSQENG